MQTVLSNLLRGFADAMLDGDFMRATAWCDSPVTLLRPTGVASFNTQAESAQDLARTWAHYQAYGVRGMRFEILHVSSYVQGFLLCDVAWSLVDGNGITITTLYSTYTMRQEGEGYKVMLVVSHNEVLERPLYADA